MSSLVEFTTLEIEYPESDGQPIGETDFHFTTIILLVQALRDYFAEQPVYIAGDLMFYYKQGNPHAVKAPDVLVVKGVSKHKRRIYKLWEERVVPCTIFEITSKQTGSVDLTTKYQLYEQLGIKEYFLFDPLDEYLQPRLQGFTLVQGRYRALPLSAEGELMSRELGLILRPQGDLLRLVDSSTGRVLATSKEYARRVEMAEQKAQLEEKRAYVETQRARSETQRANRAEAKISELQQELDRLRQNKDSPDGV